MEELVHAITSSNVPQVKTVLTSVTTALAVYQVAMIAVGWGTVKLQFLKPRAASFAHRSVGDVIVPITLLVGARSLNRYLPHFGITVFALMVVTWVTSAGDYLARG